MNNLNLSRKMPSRPRGGGFLVLFLLAGLPTVTSAESALPKGTNLTSLVVISDGAMANAAQKVMIATLQGLVARQSASQIYIDGGSGYSIWYNHLKTAYGIPYTTASNPWLLLEKYTNLISGYILYNAAANSNSLNAANSLCGYYNAIAVDASIEASVRAIGVTNRILDVRTNDEAWVWNNYNAVLSRSTVVEQRESFADNLRDYAAMSGAFTFFDGNSAFRNSIMSAMNPDAACLGWGDASQGENVFVGNSSANGVYTIPSDWALDLSTLSSIQDLSLYQRTYTIPPPETNVNYVTFVMTDGDNVQENLGSDPTLYQSGYRGQFSFGWALSPSLADLAPSVLRWYFDNASNGPNRDFFVAGPSGSGYFYPSLFPPADLDLQVEQLNDFMTRADLDIVQILDFNSFTDAALWNHYLAQPNINALIYLEYSQYNAQGGAMYFSTNGKPILSCSDLIWGGLESPAQVVANVNNAPRDLSSPASYRLVEYHLNDSTYPSLASVLQVVTNLAAYVRVVTPEEFQRLVVANVGRKLSYDFANSLQGWVGGINGGPYDAAQWTGSAGNPPGPLLLNGSDLGSPDPVPNSWFSRQIILPPNATTLSFDTQADAGTTNGLLRVRLQDPTGTSVILLDWEQLTTTNWVTRSASLAGYAGQTVTIYFEQNDGGLGSGEYRYVDNVAINTAGAPLYIPTAPKLLTLTARNAVSLLWRDNDNNEAGFSVERSLGSNGVWSVMGEVSSNVTTYADASVSGGTAYSYRVRSWNGQGFSPYSNVRTIDTPPRPALGITFTGGNTVAVSWPAWASNFNLYVTTNLVPADYRLATNPVGSLGTNLSMTIPLNAGSSFFQLRNP